MRVLLVTPALSGETVTAVHVAQELRRAGHQAVFAAPADARRLIPQGLLEHSVDLSAGPRGDRTVWGRVLDRVRPDVVVLADHHMVVSAQSSASLGGAAGGDPLGELRRRRVCVVTFDHFGFGQCAEELVVGPRHLDPLRTRFPAVPAGMHVMLPCPMHHPGAVPGRRGDPFRYWDVPLGLPAERRRAVRGRYLGHPDDLLVMHSVPSWAWRQAEQLGLPLYRHLPDLLAYYLRDAPRPVTVVSVNNGHLLPPPSDGSVRIVNLAPMDVTAFEGLLFSADLVVTENKASISLGKAVCALRPAVALKNSSSRDELCARAPDPVRERVLAMERERPGAVFPFEIFPADLTGELGKLCLYRDNSLHAAFDELEIFGGDPTRRRFASLLADPAAREELRTRQRAYLELLRGAASPVDLLERYAAGHDRAGHSVPRR